MPLSTNRSSAGFPRCVVDALYRVAGVRDAAAMKIALPGGVSRCDLSIDTNDMSDQTLSIDVEQLQSSIFELPSPPASPQLHCNADVDRPLPPSPISSSTIVVSTHCPLTVSIIPSSSTLPRKSVRFSCSATYHDTYSSIDYDRSTVPCIGSGHISPNPYTLCVIRYELNSFKLLEMPVHPKVRANTQLCFPISVPDGAPLSQHQLEHLAKIYYGQR